MPPTSSNLPPLLDRLEGHYGRPRRPVPKCALDWILWENAAYLVPDERRKEAYLALGERTGLRPEGILALPREELRELAALGGMMPDRRVAKLIAIAETVQEEFGGDLEAVLALPVAKALRALRRFPGIGAPGADKILLFTKTHPLAALESNGLRVLVRLGFIEEAKDYSTTYRRATAALAPHIARGCPWLIRAHELLRRHGQTLCKNNAPRCDECPVAEDCPTVS